MKKNGFTLVELLGMLVILGLISLVSFYYVINILGNSTEQEYNTFTNNLYIAAEAYIEANREMYPELSVVNGTVFIGIDELLKEGYIEKIPKNPKTDAFEEKATIVAKTNNNYVIEFSYSSDDLTVNAYDNEGLILHYDGYKMPKDGFWEDLSVSKNHAVIDSSGYTWKINNIHSNTTPKAILTKNIFNLSDVMTFSILYKLDKVGGVQPLFSYRKTSSAAPMLFNYEIDGKFQLTFDSGSRKYIYNPIEANKYYKVDLVINGLMAKLYINGNLVNTFALTSEITSIISGLKLSIFGETTKQGLYNYYTNGSLYNFKVYAKELSEKQIKKNYEIDIKRFNIGG